LTDGDGPPGSPAIALIGLQTMSHEPNLAIDTVIWAIGEIRQDRQIYNKVPTRITGRSDDNMWHCRSDKGDQKHKIRLSIIASQDTQGRAPEDNQAVFL
jgi:hypothetical protein